MKNFSKPLVAALLLAALSGMAYWGWQKFSAEKPHPVVAEEKPSSTRTAPDTLKFDLHAPQLSFLQIKEIEAFPEPLVEPLNARIAYNDNHTARVFSPIAGRVIEILGETGQQIKAGDPLLRINAPDFALAAADKIKADADLERKQEAFARAKELLGSEGIALKDFESAVADLRQAEAEAHRAKARMKNLAAGGSTSPEGDFMLRAPVNGVINERHVNAGSEIRPDTPDPLFVITDPTKLWVQVDLPERLLSKVEVGQLVVIEVDAFPGESFRGKVTVIGGSLDPVTRRIQVRCELDTPQPRLKPEMFARVIPIADARSDLPRVPNSALVTQGLFSYLFVEIAPGVLQRRRVVLSLQGNEFSYVKEGLKAGERVVTSGALLLNSELSGIN